MEVKKSISLKVVKEAQLKFIHHKDSPVRRSLVYYDEPHFGWPGQGREYKFSPNTTNNVLYFISRFRFVICIIVHTRLYSSNILIFSTPFAQTCTRSHLYKPSSPPANHHNLDCHNIQNNSRNNECQPNHQHHASIPLQHPCR